MKREKVDKSFLRGTHNVRYPRLHNTSRTKPEKQIKYQIHCTTSIPHQQSQVFMIVKSMKLYLSAKSESNVIFIQMHIS